MIPASYKDKSLVADILTRAFDSNKSVNYVVKQDSKRVHRIRKLMEYSFEVCWRFGEIYLTDDKNGVLLNLLPEKKKATVKSILLDISLILNSIGLSRVFKVLERESKIKLNHPRNFIYLWYIGILPEYQGKGLGSSLLKEIIKIGDNRKLPVFLETSTKENLPLYQRFGFQIYHQIDFDSKLYLLKKEPEVTNPDISFEA